MKRFSAPMMEIQRLAPEDVFTDSTCRTQALGCPSCYCNAVSCGDTYTPDCDGCYSYLPFLDD